MRCTKLTAAAACAALALTAGAAAAQSTPADRTTFVTFSGPVSVPGATLPAGTYTFRLAESPANRHIVQIFDKDNMKLFATLLAVPAERDEAKGDPVVTFKETPADRPPAVHFWYYAGEREGNELVYPKEQAMIIARASGESVMASSSSSKDVNDWKAEELSRVTAEQGAPATASTAAPATSTAAPATTTAAPAATTAADTAAAQPPASTTAKPMAEQPAPAPVTAAPPAPMTAAPAAARPSTMEQPAPAAPAEPGAAAGTSGHSSGKLPKTASELPLVGLIGLLALGGGLALRAARAGV